MRALSSAQRKQLESAVVAARRASESASRAALDSLGVFSDRRPAHLDEGQAALRVGLRAKWRQLGGDRDLLVAECAYEQWHRLLFARFLAENDLLLHPEFKAPVTLAECDELADGLGEPDGWAVAARFASEILPGIFRLDDPCVRLRLAPEGRHALEKILDGIPAEVFRADDALGWVYQFWQKEKKDEVNASERKIGGADLGPVTQLFTENYMVRFLLDNSLGAWWAARHPDSPLVKGLEYLRFDDEGTPAAGSFDGWPDRVAEVTVMDPCCGSGHFLVEAFSMLWQMRVEEEGLLPVEAQDAVLRDNLFGLELDPRCVQIAMFSVALAAWKAGGGWRQLPVPNIACSGIPVKAPVEEWKDLAGGNERLGNALVRLHILFRDADTLGSLIDPKREVEMTDPARLQQSFEDVDWDEVAPLLAKATLRETGDPATAVLGADAASIARAADYLSRQYTLVTTNVPYLTAKRQDAKLRAYIEQHLRAGWADLSTAFLLRCRSQADGTVAMVTPENWLTLGSYASLRKLLLEESSFISIVRLGAGAFGAISGEVVKGILVTFDTARNADIFLAADVDGCSGPTAKSAGLREAKLLIRSQMDQLSNPDFRILLRELPQHPLLNVYADALAGIQTGDSERFIRYHWEAGSDDWRRIQGTVPSTVDYGGRESVVLWEGPRGLIAFAELNRTPGLVHRSTVRENRGSEAWGRPGVAVSLLGDLDCTLYTGELFDNNVAVISPRSEENLVAIWAFCSSPEFNRLVRVIDNKMNVTNRTLAKVPFDREYWSRVAKELYPDGLPEPWSDDPTQWLFEGRPEVSTEPLQVAVGRLLGFRWPEQPESDDLDRFADEDGIVCLPSVAGEPPAADRLLQLLAAAYGDEWSPGKVRDLLAQTGSKKKNLDDWLRDEFFKQHCKVFKNRPFIWHIWDGQRDGFSALVNYHRLDRQTLEKLTYSYLGTDWVERQKAQVRDEVPGAEARLAAALELQAKLEAILEGEAPLDIYVRWKPIEEQPIGWEPDLNDGVRLNIRPFVTAGVLRAKFNIHWRKDRGKNPDGSERHNDIHLTLAEKRQARRKAGKG